MLNSCVESTGFEYPESETQLVLMSTFSPDNNISAALSTSISPCCTSEVSFPENAKIELFEDGKLIGLLANDKINSRYVMDPPHFPKEKANYDIQVELPNLNITGISAQSFIPPKNSLKNVTVLSIDSTGASTFSYELDILIEFPKPELLNAYFHLIPSRQKNFIIEDPVTGEREISYTGDFEPLDIEKIVSNQNAVHILNHDSGFLVEYAKLNDDAIRLNIKSGAIKAGSEVFENLHIDFHSVTIDYYKYYKAISQSSSSNGGAIPKPINIPSNIQNGLGLFSGVNSWTASYSIR
jgi:hypothetical protein